MDNPFGYATLGCGVFYRDPVAALAWLEAAFGFKRSMLVRDKAGALAHAEIRFADAYIIINSECISLSIQNGPGTSPARFP